MSPIEIKGYAGQQLRVDLTHLNAHAEPISADISRNYLGGVGYGARILYDELAENVDPLGPENIMILATGPLSLSQVPGGGSLMLCFKSPLTKIWGASRVGGDSGPDLKKAGFDYVIIQGKSPEPVYLLIEDGKWEFHKASHLQGMTVSRKSKIIREEVDDEKASVLCIGPAGENQVKFAAVMSDDRAAGRCGGGAVWGAKNLIAIAIKGKKKIKVADPGRFKNFVIESHREIKTNPLFLGLQSGGTIGDIPGNDDGGDWPSKNWLSNSWGKGPELYDHYEAKNFIKGFGCYRGCTMACARWAHVPEGKFETPEHGGTEYESISCFTAYVLNQDMDAAVHSTYLCNELGLDTISTGSMIAFAMECFEKGILQQEKLDGYDLTWGNAAVLPEIVKAIAYRKGIGNILAEGVRNAAEMIGRGAEDFAIHVKGLEGPAHDPRSGKALAITYATGNRGMCHIQPVEAMAWDRGKLDWGLIKYGLPDPENVERWDEENKGGPVALLQDGLTLPDILGTCKFYMYGGITVDHWTEMLQALTGWEIDGHELLKISERVINLQRLFNIREGITAKDDLLSQRVKDVPTFGKYSQELECGIKDFDRMLQEYYQVRGWDPITGAPSSEKLEELGLTY
jgi:aldehyde:ferredoxin oxidoreductase